MHILQHRELDPLGRVTYRSFGPDPYTQIRAAGHDAPRAAGSGAERRVPDGGSVTLERASTAPVVSIITPDPQRIIIGARHEQIIFGQRGTRVEIYGFHIPFMTVQHSQQFEGLVVHELPEPHALVPRARREQRRGRVPRAAFHLVLMPFERRQNLPGVVLARPPPHAARRVEGRGGEQRAAGRPGDPSDSSIMSIIQRRAADESIAISTP
mmetsp:Transcript_3892/g.9747  ORF Transcript_3892/g.9747 Transcript_3892/m.9747 type:complete len:211 (+) Transcript_3892:262-894(+)